MLIPLSKDHEDYLHDESRRIGTAESISFPTTEVEVIETIKEARSLGRPITTQGARTGIVAGAVPQGGHILNLSRMKRIGPIHRDADGGTVVVQPGVLLTDLQEIVAKEQLYFPPDPTETSASLGGMVACNASGAGSFFYGPTRNWIESLRVVLADGDIIALRRGEQFAEGRRFSLKTESGRVITGELPSYKMPSVKSAAGYYADDGMDMIDLFIGMEGTIGVITEIEARLIPVPKVINGLVIFVPSEDGALKLLRALRDDLPTRPAAIEFFNHDALDLLRRMKSDNPAFEKIPTLKPHYHTAIYTEFHGESDTSVEDAVMQLMDAISEVGGSDEDTWFATTAKELEPLKAFRHAIPEAVNLLIDERRRTNPEITKLGTDMSVRDEHLEATIAMYNADLQESGLESVIFGHIGNNHVHVNILPNSAEEYEKGRSLYLSWAKRVVEVGGSVSAEHGIGKIKAPFLELMYGSEGVAHMRELKRLFDSGLVLNQGNLFV